MGKQSFPSFKIGGHPWASSLTDPTAPRRESCSPSQSPSSEITFLSKYLNLFIDLSFLIFIRDKKWSIVQGLPIDDFSRGKLDATGKELCEERDEAMAVCKVR